MTCAPAPCNTIRICRVLASGAVLLLLLCIPFVYFPGYTWEHTYLKQPLFQLTAALCLILTVLVIADPAEWIRQRLVLLIPAAGLLGMGFLSLLWHNYPWAAEGVLIREGSLFAGFIGLSCVLSSQRTRRVFLYVLSAGALAAAVVIVYQMQMGRIDYFGNRNLAGGFLVLPLVVAIAHIPAMLRRPSAASAAVLAGIFLALAALYFTQTRGAVLGVGVGVFLLLLVNVRFLRLYLWMTLAGAAIFVTLILLLKPEIVENYLGIRLYIWQSTLNMIKSAPMQGQGIGGFAAAVRAFQPAEYFAHPAAAPATLYSHCYPLQILVELGAGGLLLYIGLLAGIAAAARKAVKAFPGERIAIIGMACGLAGMAVHSLVEITANTLDVQMYFWLGAAYICGAMACAERPPRLKLTRLLPAGAIAAAAAFFFCTIALPALDAQMIMARAVRTQDPETRLEMFERAKQLQPFEDILRNSLTAELRRYPAEDYARQGRHDAAYAQYAELDALSDNLMGVAGKLAQTAVKIKDYETAASHAARALKSNPFDTPAYEAWLAAIEHGVPSPPPEQAVEMLVKAQQLHVKFETFDPLLQLYKGSFLKHAGRTQEADRIFASSIEILKQRLAECPPAEELNLYMLWMEVAKEWGDAGAFADLADTLVEFSKKVGQENMPLEIFYITALANHNAGRTERAAKQFQSMVSWCENLLNGAQPDNPVLLELLVKSYAVIDPPRSIDAARRLLQIDPENAAAQNALMGLD